MRRGVLDTNVVASAALSTDGAPALVLRGFLEGRWQLVASPEIIAEYERVLYRPALRLPPAAVRDALRSLAAAAALAYPAEAPHVCADPDDDKFLACCLAGAAGFLVTGNLRHFPRESYQGVRILAPREFLTLFPA